MLDIMGENNAYRNPNGCPLAGTFFISTQDTDYALAQRLYSQGNEIAIHTMNHVFDPSPEEIIGAYRALNAWSGVPKKDILGFRTPFLNYTTETWKRLRGTGKFLYDSSMTVRTADAVWPYTLDFGPVTPCEVGTCDRSFKIPGLWEIPMYVTYNVDGSINTSMDPMPLPGGSNTDITIPTYEQVQAMWRANFLRNYNGERRPYGLYLHAYWVLNNRQERIRALKDFIQWTLQNRDVYWVTNQQLIAWMLNPTNTANSATNPALGCATAPVNSNICDGISRNGQSCLWNNANTYQGYYKFSTCFSCPTRPPNVTDQGPVPSRANDKICFVPDDGCPHPQLWDPENCRCTNVNRLQTGIAPNRQFRLGDPIKEWIGEAGFNNITGPTGTNPDPTKPVDPKKSNSLMNVGSGMFVTAIGLLSIAWVLH